MKIKSFEERVRDHLLLREGSRDAPYLDTLGKPTVGIGHLLSIEEQEMYPLGKIVPMCVLDRWYKEDTEKAIKAALKQVRELNNLLDEDSLKLALVSVNYQLGTGWRRKFPSAWRYLTESNWKDAIAEIEYTSLGSGIKSVWNKQTPVRVKDFVLAIKKQVA